MLVFFLLLEAASSQTAELIASLQTQGTGTGSPEKLGMLFPPPRPGRVQGQVGWVSLAMAGGLEIGDL